MQRKRLYESIRNFECVYWVMSFYSDENGDEEEETEKVAGGGRREENDVASYSLRILKELSRGII